MRQIKISHVSPFPSLYLSFSTSGTRTLSVCLAQTLESSGLSITWSMVSLRRVCIPAGLDLEALQESVAVGRVLSPLVALEWTVCELLSSVHFSFWVMVKDGTRGP